MDPNPPVWVMFAPIDEVSAAECLVMARDLRTWGVPTLVDGRKGKLKKKFEYAELLQCFFTIVVGPDDLAKGTVNVKDNDESTRGNVVQHAVPIEQLGQWLAERLLGYREYKDAVLQREAEHLDRMAAVTLAISQIQDPGVQAQAHELLAELAAVSTFCAALPPPTSVLSDDGSFSVEWRLSDRRLAFTLELNRAESGWHIVSKEGGPNVFGTSAERNVGAILRQFLAR